MVEGQLASTILALFFDGLARGFLFAILGVGITLIFGLGEVLNLIHGTVAVIAALVVVSVYPMLGTLAGSIFVGLAFVAVLSLVIDRSAFVPVYRAEGEQRILMGVFVTLGLAIFLEGVLANFKAGTFSLPINLGNIALSGAAVKESSILTIVLSAVLISLLFVFLDRTYLGMAMRTVFQDETGALLCGIDPRRLRTLVFLLSSLFAGVAGLLYGTLFTLSVAKGFELTIFALIVAIVGGVRSVRGTVVAGVLLGLVVTYSNFFIGSYVATLILYVVAIGVLLTSAEGIA